MVLLCFVDFVCNVGVFVFSVVGLPVFIAGEWEQHVVVAFFCLTSCFFVLSTLSIYTDIDIDHVFLIFDGANSKGDYISNEER